MKLVGRKAIVLAVALVVVQLFVVAGVFSQSAEQAGGSGPARSSNEPSSKQFGLRVGLNSASANIPSQYGKASSKSGFVFGFLSQTRFSNNIYGCSELAYSTKGWKQDFEVLVEWYDYYSGQWYYDYVSVEVQADLAYIDADYYVKFLIPTQAAISPFISVGLTTGYLISSKIKATSDSSGSGSVDAMEAFKKFDIGFVVGAGAEMDLGGSRLAFDIRYNPGLVSVDNGGEDFKNKVTSFSASIFF